MTLVDTRMPDSGNIGPYRSIILLDLEISAIGKFQYHVCGLKHCHPSANLTSILIVTFW